jgi:hypothetical protein
MSVYESENVIIARAAYELGSRQLQLIEPLTPSEKASCPQKLKQYIEILVACGEQNPEKIAHCAIGLVREYEQIARSRARSQPNSPTLGGGNEEQDRDGLDTRG